MTFLTRNGCHLCAEAHPVVMAAAKRLNVKVEVVDIDNDDALVKQWGLRVPVVVGTHDQVIAEGIIDDVGHLRGLIQRALDI